VGLQSLDQVKIGDWLVCESGPKILVRTPFSEELEYRRDKEMEGVLIKILGINPPIVLAEAYTLTSQRAFPITISFNDAVWTRANKNYRDAYLRIRKLKRIPGAKE